MFKYACREELNQAPFQNVGLSFVLTKINLIYFTFNKTVPVSFDNYSSIFSVGIVIPNNNRFFLTLTT